MSNDVQGYFTYDQLTSGIIDDPYAQYFYFGASLVNLVGHGAGLWLFDMLMPGAHEMLIARSWSFCFLFFSVFIAFCFGGS